MKADLSPEAVAVRLERTEQLRRLCLSIGAGARARGRRFRVGERVEVASDAHPALGPGLAGRIIGRRLGPTDGTFGRAYLLELSDKREVEVGERWLIAG